MRQELNVKGEANEYLDDFIRGSSDCLDRRVHCVSRGRRADPPSACARRDLAYSAFRDGYADKWQNLSQHIADLPLRIAESLYVFPIMAIVTPVSVGTASAIEQRLKDTQARATIVSQPVFFTPGCAVEDFNWPDRILLGTSSNEAVLLVKQIFHPLVMRGVPVIVTNHETAELAREAATAFVATKISFINELSSLCEHVGADAMNLSLALGLGQKRSLHAAYSREPEWVVYSPSPTWIHWLNSLARKAYPSKY